MSKTSSWLQRQKKGDLIDLADSVGFTQYDGLLKVELDAAFQEYLEANESRLSGDARLAPFYNRRSAGSPVKRESSSALDNTDATSVVKRAVGRPVRRVTNKLAQDLANATESTSEEDPEEDETEEEAMAARTRSAAATRTPARNNQVSMLQNASNIPLPPSPAVIANNIERQTALIRSRLSESIQDSGILETAEYTRQALSTIHSIHFAIAVLEFYALRKQVLPDIYFFTIPAITTNFLPSFMHTSPWPWYVPDMFLILSSSFWNPMLLWLNCTVITPLIAAYFINLSMSSSPKRRTGKAGRPMFDPVEYTWDPLTFNIVKAVLIYVIFVKGVTFGNAVDPATVYRINDAIYGGPTGALIGTGIGILVSLYEAMLKR